MVPIYEFYCAGCHTVFSFFSTRVAPEASPACPRCGRARLPRRPSRFATLRSRGDDADLDDATDPLAGLDDERLERAFEAMATEFESLDDAAEPDPRQLSRVLRRFTDLTGLEAGPKLRDVLDRLERGEDPDALEAEMGDASGEPGDEDLSEFFRLKSSLLARRSARPRIDETLYFL